MEDEACGCVDVRDRIRIIGKVVDKLHLQAVRDFAPKSRWESAGISALLFDLREAMFRNEEFGDGEELRVVFGEVGERVNIETLAIGDEKIHIGDCVSVFVICGGVNIKNGLLKILVGLRGVRKRRERLPDFCYIEFRVARCMVLLLGVVHNVSGVEMVLEHGEKTLEFTGHSWVEGRRGAIATRWHASSHDGIKAQSKEKEWKRRNGAVK